MTRQESEAYSYVGTSRLRPFLLKLMGPAPSGTGPTDDTRVALCEAGFVAQYFGFRLHRSLLVDVPDARCILAEDLAADFIGDLRIAMTLDQLIGVLELAERLDLPLRIAPQQRVGAPQLVIRTDNAHEGADHVRALQRPAADGRGERRADFAVQVLALRLEGLQRRQLIVIRPGPVIGDEVQIQEVIRRGVEILGVRIACVELAERDALVAADVLDTQFAALLPDQVRPFLVVE